MHISKDEFYIEEIKLKEINSWLNDRISEMESSNRDLENKIAALRKESGGRYSFELDAVQKVYDMAKESCSRYIEAQDTPYFARIDFKEYRRDKETFYIGRTGLEDEKSGDQFVVDWRAPIADLYYSGTQGNSSYHAPSGIIEGDLQLKRKFLIKESRLKDAFDEGINQIILKGNAENAEGNGLDDEFLRINLEEGVSQKLKDIVATIQKEQNDIIRADRNKVLVVQGSAGSGKTTVALHRLAYLLYRYKETVSGEDILVIAPNEIFLDYISDVLPNLGAAAVPQKTFEKLALEILHLDGNVYSKDEKLSYIIENYQDNNIKFVTNSSKVRGSMVFKTMMDRYLKYLEVNGPNYTDVETSEYVLFSRKEIKRLFTKDFSHLPISMRRDEIVKYLNNRLGNRIQQIHDTIDDEFEARIFKVRNSDLPESEKRKDILSLYDERDSKKIQIREQAKKSLAQYLENWKQDDIQTIYNDFFMDKDIFEKISSNKIPYALAEYMRQEQIKNAENNIIDSDDLAAMLYLKLNMFGIKGEYKFKHIVIDEAQDYSLFEFSVLRSFVSNDSFTIVGDIGQGIYFYKGISDWSKFINDVYNNHGEYVPLKQSYRSTVEIVTLANIVLEKQNINLTPAKPVLRHGEKPQFVTYNSETDFCYKIDEIVKRVELAGRKNVSLICKTLQQCENIKILLQSQSSFEWKIIHDTEGTLTLDKIIIPAYMTKGLEFDCSVIIDCDNANYKDSELDKKLLYVALTRALHFEYILYKDELSTLIK